jgi:hypothetical protein
MPDAPSIEARRARRSRDRVGRVDWLTFLGVNIFAQNIVFAAVLIGAVAITIDRSKIPIVK